MNNQRLTNIALGLYDWEHLLGHRVSYSDWRRIFRPKASNQTAERSWQREKDNLRAAGIKFRLEGINGGLERLAIVFESRDYMRKEVHRLIGDPEHYAGYAGGKKGAEPTEEEVLKSIKALNASKRY